MSKARGLTAKQAVFVAEYLVCLNASEAARRAGYSVKTATWIGPQLLVKTHVAAAIEEQQRDRLERLKIDADGLAKIWTAVATADTNEVVQFRRDSCRHCWGVDFNYQCTPAEYKKAQLSFEERRAKILADGGRDIGDFPSADGDWYDRRRRPNPDCPECFGDGVGAVRIADTRDLSEAGKAIYGGVKEGRDGIEVKLHDQQAATEKLGRALGVFRDGGDGAKPGSVIDSELAMRYVDLMEKSRLMQLRALEERGIPLDEDGQ